MLKKLLLILSLFKPINYNLLSYRLHWWIILPIYKYNTWKNVKCTNVKMTSNCTFMSARYSTDYDGTKTSHKAHRFILRFHLFFFFLFYKKYENVKISCRLLLLLFFWVLFFCSMWNCKWIKSRVNSYSEHFYAFVCHRLVFPIKNGIFYFCFAFFSLFQNDVFVLTMSWKTQREYIQ